MTASTPFQQLGLPDFILSAVQELGYETATPIQAESIPVLLERRDLLAQAQTGTGKTAAFALPILAQINLQQNAPQALIIAPTRELAIQVAEAFQSYAKHLKDFHVAPIYGGQGYDVQLRALKHGVHVIVGTPGRLMDHMRRGSLSVKHIQTVILDEADEMLKMGFIDDIEWILGQIPHEHQTGLFSATIPASIQKIAKNYLNNAKKIQIESKQASVTAIEQSYIRVANKHKLEVLTRYLEVESIDAAIIFARTKNSSAELAEKLQARGYAAAALNGDMQQALRKKVIERTKSGSLDIIVATDVAPRGIDIERINHVINFDIPYDTESYTHRIGRTGRAGRAGKALLLITPREHRLLHDIERDTNTLIKQIEPPSIQEMREKRNQLLSTKIIDVIQNTSKLEPFQAMITHIMNEIDCRAEDVAAALAYLTQQSNPLATYDIESPEPEYDSSRKRASSRHGRQSGRRPSEGRSSERRQSEGRPSERRPSERRSSERRSSERRSSEGRQFEGRPSEKRQPERRSSEGRQFEGRPSERRQSEGRPSERRQSEGRPSEGRPSGERQKERSEHRSSQRTYATKENFLDEKSPQKTHYNKKPISRDAQQKNKEGSKDNKHRQPKKDPKGRSSEKTTKR